MPGTIIVKLNTNRFPELSRKMPEVVGRLVEESARRIVKDAQDSMAGAKHGRVYTRNGADHQASAPGEAPAIDTGALADSLRYEMTKTTRATVFSDSEYAAPLEYGAPAAGIAPRPFLTPAAERERPQLLNALRDLEDKLL